jgi:nitroreductase
MVAMPEQRESSLTNANARHSVYPIDPMFLERWSPRAFTGEGISAADLMTIMEAARLAPSSYNSQPWRFIYARRDTPHWDTFLDLLVPFNRSWAKDAAALLVLVSNPLMKPPGSDNAVPPTVTRSMRARRPATSLSRQTGMAGTFTAWWASTWTELS